jgi:predicted phosphate transport protein (TIGR00153 family)
MFSILKFFKNSFEIQRKIEKDLDDYLENLNAIVLDMRQALGAYLDQDIDTFLRSFSRINELEHRLDTLRRDIETAMYERRLLPDTRSDILGLLETVDKIPNRIQSTTREMNLQKIRIPEQIHPSLIELSDRGVQIVHELIAVIRAFLARPHDVKSGAKQLSAYEHEADLIEEQAVTLTFDNSHLDLAHKIQLHRLIERMGSICDMAEDVGDRLMVSSLKRVL